jgi:hypothetical protein
MVYGSTSGTTSHKWYIILFHVLKIAFFEGVLVTANDHAWFITPQVENVFLRIGSFE